MTDLDMYFNREHMQAAADFVLSAGYEQIALPKFYVGTEQEFDSQSVGRLQVLKFAKGDKRIDLVSSLIHHTEEYSYGRPIVGFAASHNHSFSGVDLFYSTHLRNFWCMDRLVSLFPSLTLAKKAVILRGNERTFAMMSNKWIPYGFVEVGDRVKELQTL